MRNPIQIFSSSSRETSTRDKLKLLPKSIMPSGVNATDVARGGGAGCDGVVVVVVAATAAVELSNTFPFLICPTKRVLFLDQCCIPRIVRAY